MCSRSTAATSLDMALFAIGWSRQNGKCRLLCVQSLSLIQNLYFVYDFVILYTDCKLYADFCNLSVLFILIPNVSDSTDNDLFVYFRWL